MTTALDTAKKYIRHSCNKHLPSYLGCSLFWKYSREQNACPVELTLQWKKKKTVDALGAKNEDGSSQGCSRWAAKGGLWKEAVMPWRRPQAHITRGC